MSLSGKKQFLDLVQLVEQEARAQKLRAFVVGGAVRDMLRGELESVRDFDFVIEGDARDFARSCQMRIGGTLEIFETFLTAKIVRPVNLHEIDEVDFATARTESYPEPGSLPIVAPTTVEGDLGRRDFSINAMALPVGALVGPLSREGAAHQIEDHILDPFAGRTALREGIIEILHPASFRDDPTRIYRALRYMVRLSGRLSDATADALRNGVNENFPGAISDARKLTEIRKGCWEEPWLDVLSQFARYGLIRSAGINWPEEVLRTIDSLAIVRKELRFDLFLISAFHELPAPEREGVFRRLGFGRKFFKNAADVVSVPAASANDTALLYRLARSRGDDDVRAECRARGLMRPE